MAHFKKTARILPLLMIVVCLLFVAPAYSSEPPFKLPAADQLARLRAALISTDRGDIYVRLFPELAPWHVANFKYLSEQGFYNNLPFHLFEENYFIQTGAPNKRPNSGPNYTLPPEFNSHKHVVGTLSMVRKPNELDVSNTRRSHGSQFRFMLKDSTHLDGQYTAFGQVMRGISVLKELRKGDRIKKIQVYVAESSRL